jgi:hypothetical protein
MKEEKIKSIVDLCLEDYEVTFDDCDLIYD